MGPTQVSLMRGQLWTRHPAAQVPLQVRSWLAVTLAHPLCLSGFGREETV